MRRTAARVALGVTIVIAGSACARENPEFGLGGGGGGTAGSTTGEDTGPMVPGQETMGSDATAGLDDDGPMTTGATTDPTTADTSTSDDGLDTADVSDSGGNLCEVPLCQPYVDGCSDGLKCTLFDDGGDGTFEKLGCSAIVNSPAAELDECTHDACWQDTCGAGLACAPTGQGAGICRAICHEIEDPCDGPEQVCVEVLGPVGLCRVRCEVLLQNCPDGEGCFFQIATAEPSCAPANRANEAGAACASYNDCAVGYQCMPSDVIGGCPGGGTNCCATLCDTATGDACSADENCIGLGVPGQPEAGVCVG